MDLLCPNCENTLTPSVVGYLCVGCGEVHKFYRTPDGTPIDPDIKRRIDNTPTNTTGQPLATVSSIQQPANHTNSTQFKRTLKTRLKQMVVPELPPVIDDAELKSADKPLLNSIPDSTVFRPALADGQSLTAGSTPRPAATQPSQTDQTGSISPQKGSSTKKIILIGIVVAALLAITTLAGIVVNRSSTSTPAKVTEPAVSSVKPADNSGISAAAVDRDNQRKRDLKEISTALEVYKQDSGTYPVGSDIAAIYPLQYTNPPYIKFVSYDPASTEVAKVKYIYSSDGKTFTLKAKLENPQDSTAKDGYYIVSGS